jgi:hypothetical protein
MKIEKPKRLMPKIQKKRNTSRRFEFTMTLKLRIKIQIELIRVTVIR